MLAREDSLITTVTARLFVRELRARGIDATAALQAAGITRKQLEDGQHVLPWARYATLFEALYALVPEDDLGVLAGARIDIADLDLAGLYMRSSATGGDVVEFHEQHRRLLEPSPIVNCYLSEQGCVVAFVPLPRSRAGLAFADGSLAAAVTLARAIAGPIEPLEVRLRRPRPASVEAYTRVLGTRLCFESPVDEVLFPHELLTRALPQRDDAVRAVLRPHLARQLELAEAAAADLPTRASLSIRHALAKGTPSAQAVAEHLQVSVRTLRRSLRAHTTSYSALLAQVRCELALRYAVEAPRRSGPEIARLLGYSEAHTFYRAFKRWTGLSLSEYRQRDVGRAIVAARPNSRPDCSPRRTPALTSPSACSARLRRL